MTFLSAHQFRNRYGERIYIIARRLEKLYQQKMRIDEHIAFLKECKQQNVIPMGMLIKNTTQLRSNRELIHNTMTKIRNNTSKQNKDYLTILCIIEWETEIVERNKKENKFSLLQLSPSSVPLSIVIIHLFSFPLFSLSSLIYGCVKRI